jgi:hypothetical protein
MNALMIVWRSLNVIFGGNLREIFFGKLGEKMDIERRVETAENS